MAYQFQPPNFDPNEGNKRIANTLENLYNTYWAARQRSMQEKALQDQQAATMAQFRSAHGGYTPQQANQFMTEAIQPQEMQATPAQAPGLMRSEPWQAIAPQGGAPRGVPRTEAPITQPQQMQPKPLSSGAEYFKNIFESQRQAQKQSALSGAAKLENLQADTLSKRAEARKLEMEAGPGSKEQVAVENTLRDELNKLSQPFQQVRDSFGRIKAAAKNPSAAGDLALIFNYMKVLDPGSTVREGEFATAQNSAGIPQRLVAQYNKVVNGERLAPEQRQDFVGRAEDLYKSQEAIQKHQEDQYREIAKRSRARPENVVISRGLQPVAPNDGGIQIRTLRDGSSVRVKPDGKGGFVEVP